MLLLLLAATRSFLPPPTMTADASFRRGKDLLRTGAKVSAREVVNVIGRWQTYEDWDSIGQARRLDDFSSGDFYEEDAESFATSAATLGLLASFGAGTSDWSWSQSVMSSSTVHTFASPALFSLPRSMVRRSAVMLLLPRELLGRARSVGPRAAAKTPLAGNALCSAPGARIRAGRGE